MLKFRTFRTGVGALAYLAMAAGYAVNGLAQDQSRNQDQNQQQASNQSDQNQQDQQRQQQRDQQQRDQQQRRQSSQSSQNRSQRETASWPEPNRDDYSQQQATQYQSDRERQTARSSSGDERDAGLGVTITSSQGRGVTVTRVFRGTPADRMGIRQGDRISQLNGQQVRSTDEFINRIRNMNPGDEVELSVLRDRGQQTIRGELETRQEALQLTSRQQQQWQGDESWQAGYSQGGRTSRSGDFSGRLSSIEQQVDRLSRQLDQIRVALQDLRQGGSQQFSRSRESQAGYDEYQGGIQQSDRYGTREQSGQWDGQRQRQSRESDQFQRLGQPNWSNGGQFDDSFDTDTPGGETGGERTRPGNSLND